MLAYILVVIFPLVVEFFYKRRWNNSNVLINELKAKRVRWIYIFLAALPMFLLIALRNESIGPDTGMYINHFNKMVNIPWSKIFDQTRMEKGYIIFVKLITLFTNSSLVYQIICATIYLLALTSFTNQLDENHFFVLFLFGTLGMYTFMFTGVRQCLAISICLFSFKFIKRRKLIPFLILMFISFYFHKSSILFIAAYFIYPRKLSVWTALIYIVITIFAVLCIDLIQEWFNEQLDYEYGVEGGAGGIIYAIITIAMTLITIFFIMANKSNSKSAQGLINIGIIATIFWVVRIFNRVAERPSFYFLICVFAAFAYAISTLKSKRDQSVIKIVVFVFALALLVYRLMNNVMLVPYMFFWF